MRGEEEDGRIDVSSVSTTMLLMFFEGWEVFTLSLTTFCGFSERRVGLKRRRMRVACFRRQVADGLMDCFDSLLLSFFFLSCRCFFSSGGCFSR